MVPLTVLANVMAAVAAPLHNTCPAGTVMVGVGPTVMVKLPVVPLQPLATGVTVTIPVMGNVPVLVAVNGAMSPVPGDARPMEVLLFTQL
jgi:hypothetical protein